MGMRPLRQHLLLGVGGHDAHGHLAGGDAVADALSCGLLHGRCLGGAPRLDAVPVQVEHGLRHNRGVLLTVYYACNTSTPAHVPTGIVPRWAARARNLDKSKWWNHLPEDKIRASASRQAVQPLLRDVCAITRSCTREAARQAGPAGQGISLRGRGGGGGGGGGVPSVDDDIQACSCKLPQRTRVLLCGSDADLTPT